jgi:protoheme ferro-lyase
MTDEHEAHIAGLIEWLESNDRKRLMISLHSISARPTGDERVIPYLEKLLEDRRVISSPPPHFRYMEIRFVAAMALAFELDTQERYQSFVLKNTFRPLQAGDISWLAKQANISRQGKSYEQLLEELLAANLVPLIDDQY